MIVKTIIRLVFIFMKHKSLYLTNILDKFILYLYIEYNIPV